MEWHKIPVFKSLFNEGYLFSTYENECSLQSALQGGHKHNKE